MEIRLIKKSEWEKLLAFNKAEYGEKHILTDKAYYNWQFDNFANPSPDSYFTVGLFDNKGELVGTFGRFLLPYNFYGKTVQGNCMANLIVKKSLRHLGFGYLLLEKAAVLGDIAIDHTINAAAWPMFMKAGWQGENLKRYIYIIKTPNALYNVPASAHKKLDHPARHFDAVKRFGPEADEFWSAVKSRYPITIERSAAYLNWRYAENSLVDYKIFYAKNPEGRVAGFAILRFEDIRHDTGPAGVKAARVIDLIAAADAEEFMLEGVIDYCRAEGADFIDYFSSGEFHKRALLAAGFIDGDQKPYDAIPILFNPLSTKRTHLNFAVKAPRFQSLQDWYTTKGGGDQDRP